MNHRSLPTTAHTSQQTPLLRLATSRLPAWVPVRSLAPRHRHRIAKHLKTLSGHDRHLRFGHAATDEQIDKYVESIDFERDEVFGVFNWRVDLIAMAHLANAALPRRGASAVAEFGVSVAAKARGRGYGARLFEHAVMHARNRRVQTLLIHALSENTAMLQIVRKAGAKVDHHGPDTEARLKLPPETVVTKFGEMLEQQAAEVDYRLKVQAQDMVAAMSEAIKHLSLKFPFRI